MKSLNCPNRECPQSGKTIVGNIIRFGFYKTRWGKRRRFRCRACEKTFCSNTATPYYRLQHRRATFDQVATLSVEGLNKSAIARVQRIAWNTVDRWLEKAGDCGRRFNDQKTTGFRVTELQADEIRTIIKGKQRRSGSSRPSRSGLDFGLRLWSADAATKTRWRCFEMFLNERHSKIFL
jgi:transposase-like protein